MPNIKKIAIVVQRYGLQVNGGAEVHARMIAEKLSQNYYVTVLTSCAIDYKTWAPVLEAGESFENGIRILRFAPGKSRYRKHKTFNQLRERNLVQKIYKKLGRPQWWSKIFPRSLITPQDGNNWLEAQGPYLPELIKYLHDNKDRFNAFIFFTALYYPSAMGVLAVPDKSILIPTLHDEMPVYFAVYQKVMAAPRWIFFNTKAEQQFSDNIFPAAKCKKEIVAVGIDPVSAIKDENVFVDFGIKAPYIIYAGRVDEAKGCDVLLAYFIKFINETNLNLRLVFVGMITMEKKHHPHVTFTGFIDEQKKQQLIMQAEALVMPSVYESLSLVLLESFAAGIPVIANGAATVLKDHITLSDGGWLYYNYNDFKNILQQLINDKFLKNIKGSNGLIYARNNYSWQKVISKFDAAIQDIELNTSSHNFQ